MSAYLLSIIGIVLLTAILSAVLPDGKTVKFIKGIAKLCCLAVILAPVLGFFKEASDGKINFPFFSSETVIETDGAFIDYCSTKRIENAETELEKKLEETFSVRVGVTLLWEYCGSIAEGEEDGYLSVYEGNQNHQSVGQRRGRKYRRGGTGTHEGSYRREIRLRGGI